MYMAQLLLSNTVHPSKEINQTTTATKICPTTAQYAKDTIVCVECFKPRVVYAKKLLPQEMQDFRNAIQDVHYTCGSALGYDGEIFNKLQVRENITCGSPLEKSYYAKFPAACFHCGNNETKELTVAADKYPICEECVRQKKKPKQKPKLYAPANN